MDIVDVITQIFIILPAIVISMFSRAYIRELGKYNEFVTHLSKSLGIDELLILNNSQNKLLMLKLVATYVLLGILAFQVYDISPSYVYAIPAIAVVVTFAFYGNNDGFDSNDAASFVVRILSNISSANRLQDVEKSKKLGVVCDYVIKKYNLNKTGDVFVSDSYMSFADTLSGSDRVAYKAKSLSKKTVSTFKVLAPVVGMVILAVLIKSAIR